MRLSLIEPHSFLFISLFFFIYINKTAERFTGYSGSELIGKLPDLLNAEENAAAIQKEIYACMEGNRKWSGELRQKRKDGSAYTAYLDVFSVREGGGDPVAFVSIQRDITGARAAEEALRESEKRLRLLTDNAMDMISFCDPNFIVHYVGELVENERKRLFLLLDSLPAFIYLVAPDHSIPFANRCFKEIFGHPGGNTCYEVLQGLKEPCQNCRTFEVFETGKPNNLEWQRFDGSTYRIYNYPFSDLDGSPLVLIMGIDILTPQGDVLGLVPVEGLVEMFRTEVRPHLVHHEKVRIDGLHRQKTAEPSPAAPADNQVNPGNVPGGDMVDYIYRGCGRAKGLQGVVQVPLPAVIDQKVNPDDVFSENVPAGILRKLRRKHPGRMVSDDQQGSVPVGQKLYRVHTGLPESVLLNRRALGIVLGEAVKGQFVYAQLQAKLIEHQPRL